MGPLAFIVLLLKIVSFLVGSSSAIKCYECRFNQNVAEGYQCSFGGTNFPVTEVAKHVKADFTELAVAESAGAGAEVEVCLTYYGTSETNGLYFVQRGNIKTKATLRDCQENAVTLNKLCLCDTDLCNDKIPPGILKCHLCVHMASTPNPGCESGTDTFKTVARSGGDAGEQNSVPTMSKVTEIGLNIRKTPEGAAAGRQSAAGPNKYQKCFFFEGTHNDVQTLVRAKAYFPEDFNGCFQSPKPYNGIHGKFCYCSTELCNSQPGTPGGFNIDSPRARASCLNVHSLGFYYAFVIALVSIQNAKRT